MLATYVRGGSLTHVREPPVPYWTTQRLQAYRVPTPRSSAWRPPATQAFTTPSDMRLRFALRTVGMAMGPPLARGCHLCQQRCWRSRCPRAPRVRRRRPVGAAVRCGAGGCNRFCSCLTSKAPASQPASQPGRGAPFGTAPWYLLALADGGRTLRRSPTQGQLLQHEHPFGISGRTPVQIAKSTKKHE